MVYDDFELNSKFLPLFGSIYLLDLKLLVS